MSLWMLIPTAVVALCIVGEAFFAAAELSIVSANRIRLEERVVGGSLAARRVLWFREHPDRLFGTTLLGTNLCTVVGSTVAALTLSSIDPEHGQWWAMAIMSPLILVGAELLPKSLAQSRATAAACLLAVPLDIVHRLITPIIKVVQAYAKLLYWVLGIDPKDSKFMVSRDEIALLMESDDDHHELHSEERQMISRIFAFSEMRARESMVPLAEIVALPQTATVLEATALMAHEGYSRVPVHRERVDDIVGVVHHLDLLRADSGDTEISQLMHPPYFVPESQDVDDILILLQREAGSMAIVVDEFGGAVGLLTLEDVLEEIVGDIQDEHDDTDHWWRSAPDGGFIIAARTAVAKLNADFGTELPEDAAYETVAGYVLDQLRRIPRVGEAVVTPSGRRLTVRRANERAIVEVHMSGPGPTPREQ